MKWALGFLLAAGGAGILVQATFRASGTGAVDRTAMSKLRDVVSVKDFGATGNGSTDDTSAIAAAYNAINTSTTTTGTIVYPTGTYKATNVKLKNKLTLEGQGIESTTLSLGSTVGTLITSDITNNSFAGMSRLTVRGTAGVVGQKLLQIQGLFASYFNQVFWSSAENLVELSEVEGQTFFRDCSFESAGANGYGLRLNNVEEVIIENSPFENSAHGVYATRTNAVTRLKFDKIHSENVGQLFNIDTATNDGSVSFRDINALNVGANLADPTTGYAFRVNNEYAVFDNVNVVVTGATTPVIVTPLWSIFATDCPHFSGQDTLECYIPHFEIGYGSAYIPNVKTPLLSNGTDFAGLYTVTGGAAVVTSAGTGAFSGLGQYRIRPLTRDPITDNAVMVRFEYKSTTAASETLNIDNMAPQLTGFSGSTVSRLINAIVLPSTSGVWTKAYMYVRFTGEFNQGTAFFYINSTNIADTMEFRSFDVFAVDRPPYSLMDWGGAAGEKANAYLTAASGSDAVTFATNGARMHLGTGTGDWLSSDGTNILTGGALTVAGGITGNGAGFKHKRISTGSIGAGARADVTVTWGTTFVNSSYSVVCSVVDTSAAGAGLRVERQRSAVGATTIAQVINDSAGALTGTLECIAVHD